MPFKKVGEPRRGDHAGFKIINSADIGQFGKAHHGDDVHLLATRIDGTQIVLEMVNKVPGLLQGIAMFLEKNTLTVVADFLLYNDGVIEALERRVRERPSGRRYLPDTLPCWVIQATFVTFDLYAKQVALRVDQEITFQKQSRFGGVWNDGVRNADGLPVVQDLLSTQLSQGTETELLIQFNC